LALSRFMRARTRLPVEVLLSVSYSSLFHSVLPERNLLWKKSCCPGTISTLSALSELKECGASVTTFSCSLFSNGFRCQRQESVELCLQIAGGWKTVRLLLNRWVLTHSLSSSISEFAARSHCSTFSASAPLNTPLLPKDRPLTPLEPSLSGSAVALSSVRSSNHGPLSASFSSRSAPCYTTRSSSCQFGASTRTQRRRSKREMQMVARMKAWIIARHRLMPHTILTGTRERCR